MPSKYWIKLYHEILDDPKMCRLPDHLYRRAIELFLLAGKNGEDGSLPSLDDMAWILRTPEDQLLADLQELAAIQIVTDTDEGWLVTHFAKRQEATPSTERVKRYREREKKRRYYGNASETQNVTARYTEPEEKEKREEVDPPYPPNHDGNGSDSPDKIKEQETAAVYKAWEQARGLLMTPIDAQQIGELIDTYSPLWVKEAIYEANASRTAGLPSIKYISAILTRWQQDGFRAPRGDPTQRADAARDKHARIEAARKAWIEQGYSAAEIEAAVQRLEEGP